MGSRGHGPDSPTGAWGIRPIGDDHLAPSGYNGQGRTPSSIANPKKRRPGLRWCPGAGNERLVDEITEVLSLVRRRDPGAPRRGGRGDGVVAREARAAPGGGGAVVGRRVLGPG